MTENEYWDKKHTEIANQFKVRVKTVEMLRSFALGGKMTRAQIIMWLKAKIDKTRLPEKCTKCHGTGKQLSLPNPKIEHAEALGILEKSTERDWKEIVYPYKFK